LRFIKTNTKRGKTYEMEFHILTSGSKDI